MSAPRAREDGIALWHRIAAALRAEIEDGRLAPGARLPSEAALAARFGVNRHTARHGLDALVREGLIESVQGRGSFVAEDVLDYAIGPRARFSEWVRRHNREPSGQVLRLAELPADAATARALGLAEGAAVILLERLGLADARPVSLTTHHFPASLGPGLLAALAEAAGISAALAAIGVPDYRRQTTRVTARMPTAAEARLLRIPRARPLLAAENINVDAAGRVVEFGLARYPTPRVQLVFEPGTES